METGSHQLLIKKAHRHIRDRESSGSSWTGGGHKYRKFHNPTKQTLITRQTQKVPADTDNNPAANRYITQAAESINLGDARLK